MLRKRLLQLSVGAAWCVHVQIPERGHDPRFHALFDRVLFGLFDSVYWFHLTRKLGPAVRMIRFARLARLTRTEVDFWIALRMRTVLGSSLTGVLLVAI